MTSRGPFSVLAQVQPMNENTGSDQPQEFRNCWGAHSLVNPSRPHTHTLWSGHRYVNYRCGNANRPLLTKGPYNCQRLKCPPVHSQTQALLHSPLRSALPCQLILHCLAGPTCRGPQRQYLDSRLECFNTPSNQLPLSLLPKGEIHKCPGSPPATNEQ